MYSTLLKALAFYCNDIFTIYVVGFVAYNFCYLLLRKTSKFINEIFLVSTRIFPIAVAIYLLFFGILTYYLLYLGSETVLYRTRILGAYYWAYWLSPFLYALMALVNFGRSIWLRLVLVVLGVIALLPMEKLLIILSVHRDYLPSSWGYQKSSDILKFCLEGVWRICFSLAIYMLSFMLLRKTLRK